MGDVVLPNTFTNGPGHKIDADEVMANFRALRDVVNGQLDRDNLAGGAAGLAGGAFHAYNSDAAFQLAAGGGATKVKLNAEEFDPSGWFDATTNWRYQPQVAGYYRLSAYLELADPLSANEFLRVYVRKNNVDHRRLAYPQAPGTTPLAGGGSCVVQANGSTDYFELWALQNDPAARLVGTGIACWFAGELIGES